MKKRLSMLLFTIGLAIIINYIIRLPMTTNPQTNNVQDTFTEAKNIEKDILNEDLFLVNRKNIIAKDFIPKSLRIPNVDFVSYADPEVRKMDTVAATALEKMFNDAKVEGILLLAVSGYRDYSYQQKLYADAKLQGEEEYVAPPGASEHQTGLAMDVLSNKHTTLDEGFDKTQAFQWLQDNCYKYGFIIRYPKGTESITGYKYEPWHIRYVGVDGATEITQKQITLEEYMGRINTL